MLLDAYQCSLADALPTLFALSILSTYRFALSSVLWGEFGALGFCRRESLTVSLDYAFLVVYLDGDHCGLYLLQFCDSVIDRWMFLSDCLT